MCVRNIHPYVTVENKKGRSISIFDVMRYCKQPSRTNDVDVCATLREYKSEGRTTVEQRAEWAIDGKSREESLKVGDWNWIASLICECSRSVQRLVFAQTLCRSKLCSSVLLQYI